MIAQLIESMDADTVCGLAGVCMEAAAAVPPPALPASLVRILAGVKVRERAGEGAGGCRGLPDPRAQRAVVTRGLPCSFLRLLPTACTPRATLTSPLLPPPLLQSLHRPPPPHMMLVLAALGVPPPKSMPGMMGGPGGPDGHVHGPGGHMHGRDMQQMGPGSGPIMPFGGPPPHFCLAGALNDACDYCKVRPGARGAGGGERRRGLNGRLSPVCPC